jgi:hypothetical protein
MEPEDKRKLDRALSLAEENNQLLRKLRSAQKTSSMFKTIFWILTIAVTASAYYYVKPFYDSATSMIAKANSELSTVNAALPKSIK